MGIENQLHRVLDVRFGDDKSRLRTGHGARNMAVVRHFALNLIRATADKNSLKTRRRLAAWSERYLATRLNLKTRQLGFAAPRMSAASRGR